MARPDLGAIIAQTMAPPDEARSIEVITGEIVELKKQAGEAILEIGRRLIEAKDMLSHGEWQVWLEEQVEFSERSAQRFMRLAREWSNPTALSDLGATQALALLALPPEERESFLQDNNVIDMSARQLEQAIRERDEARAAAERAAAEQRTAEEARAKMEENMRLLNARLEGNREDRERAMQDVARLEAELAELKAKPVDVAVETVVDQEAIDKARAEAVAEMQVKLDKAKEAAEKARDKQKQAEASVEILKRSMEEQARAEKKAALGADKDVAQFEVLFNQGQELAQKMKGYLRKARGRENGAVAQGMEKAMLALSDLMRRCAE
jgi:chromosome segregation ATPase